MSAVLVDGPAHGSLTLNPDGSFTYLPEADFNGADQFIYRAFDGDLESADATVTITVTPVNEAPVAVNDAYTTDEDVELQIPAPGVLTNDSDPDGDALNAAIVNDPSHGSLTLNPDGSFVYTPELDFHGVDQFVYRVTDGELESAVAAVTITVNGAEDAPIADDLTVETVKNRSVDITLQGHDGDNDPLTYQIVDAPQHGTLSGTDNDFTYTPEADFLGQDSFTYLLNDGTTDSNIATVTVTVLDIDLAISDVDVSQTVFDPQTMSLTGTVTVTFENAGIEEISDPYEIQVYVEDPKTATITELGTATVSTPLAAGATLTVDVSITGTILFKDQPVYAFVDSVDVIAESNEDNNIAHSLIDCQMTPAEPGSFNPVLEWEWTESDVMPDYTHVCTAPVVAQLTDDNADGRITEDDIPDIIFPAFKIKGREVAILRALSGDGSGEVFPVSGYNVQLYSSPSVGDIDQDGLVEIIILEEFVEHLQEARVLAFEHDGTFKWASDYFTYDHLFTSDWGSTYSFAPGTFTLADLDHDGLVEIIMGSIVLNHDGTTRWIGEHAKGGHYSIAADLNLDGTLELIDGNSAYYADGSLFWHNDALLGVSEKYADFHGVANFDTDAYPEIVLVTSGYVYLLEHTGDVIWGPIDLPPNGTASDHGGVPVIADVDGDGLPEIGIAGGSNYVVLESDGNVKWIAPTQDVSSNITGSSAFDFDGDGSVEIVYADETHLRIYRGTDGEVLFTYLLGSGTGNELPVIVDVDQDNNAEIVVVSNVHRDNPTNHGIQVFGDANDSWVNTRTIWNQHSYHVTNVNDGGTIPQYEANSWEVHNTYRCNLIDNPLACEDYSASYIRVDTANYPDSVDIIARIGNAGIVDLAVPLDVAFYHGDPQAGGTLIGTTTLDPDLPSGSYEDVSLTWNTPPLGVTDISVVVDDDGTGTGKIRESDETNNVASTTVFFNAPPVAEDDAYSTDEDIPLQIPAPGLLANDTDANGETLSAVLVEESTHGSLVLDPDGSFTYTPGPDFHGTDHFTYQATDGSRSSEDGVVTITVNPLNDPPVITTEPVKKALPDPHIGDPEVFDLSTWTPMNYTFAGSDTANWTFDPTYTIATQTRNAHATILLSDVTLQDARITGTWRVNTGSDDDFMGFAFGYQDPQHFYLFDWKKGAQSTWCGYADQGMSVKVVKADSPLTAYDLWPTSGNGNRVKALYHNTSRWEADTDYQFILQVVPGYFTITVKEGDQILDHISITDSTYLSGRFGFYNLSQSHVQYSGFARQTIVEPAYSYDADAIDADADPLTYRLLTSPEGMLINEVTGQIFWEPTPDQIGEHPVNVLVEDGNGGSDEQAFLVSVSDATNNFPMITSIAPSVVIQGETYTYDADAMDADSDPLTFSLSTSPDGMIIDSDTGVCTWNPDGDDLGQHTVTVRVTDGRGGFDEQTFTLYVIESNLPPQITSEPITQGTPEMEYTYDVEASDSDYDRLTYTLVEAPEGMIIDPLSGLITWTPTYAQLGDHGISIQVTDLLGSSDVQDVTLTITSQGLVPQVYITAPADGTTISRGDTIIIKANATDEDGEIVRVEFYAGSTLLGEDPDSPYEISWTATTSGIYVVTAVAYDNDGTWATSDPVTVIMPNRPPEITSNPPVTVEHETTFSYDVEASDPDNDTLTFSLTEAPSGMTIDANTGQITWTPTLAQVGAHPVTVIVEDGNGAGASQSFTIHVTQPQAGNQFAPSITSIPSTVVILGETYSYDVEATDGDGDPLTYSLSIAPSGMTIDAGTGLITWTPVEAQLGMHDVTVLGDDGRGGIGGQYFNILVREPNQPPTVSIGYPTTNQQVRVGDTVTIQAQAADADGTVARVEFFEEGTLIGQDAAAPYEITWTPSELGQRSLTATAYDNEDANTTSDPITVEVLEALPDTEPPMIDITVNPEHVQLGDDVMIQVTITDDSPISDITLEIDGTPVPIVNNQATYTSQSVGFHTVTVTATDAAGNTGTGSEMFGVYSGTDSIPPEVDLDDDVEFRCVELAADLYDINGSISDDNEVHYTLQTRNKGCGAWQTLAEGTSASPLSGVLATFDPTIARNGLHEVRLWAEDTAGNEASVGGCLLLDGRFKAGQASIGGIDFNIPQLGYPLLVGRVYDSRNSCEGGFGDGWSMPHEASNIQVDYTYDPAQGWGEDARGTFFTTYYLISHYRKVVVLRLGDGAVFKFKMDVNPKSSFMYPIMDYATPLTVGYIPVDETEGTLEALGVSSEVFLVSGGGGTLIDGDGNTYDPARFRLTLDDGTVYVFDKYQGLLSITDAEGYTESYTYDADGNVLSKTNKLGYTNSFTYDADGNVLSETDPLSNTMTYTYDSQGNRLTETDPFGNTTEYTYDAHGNPLTTTDALGNTSSLVYDADGLKISETDALGDTSTYDYDGQGNLIQKTDPLGNTTAYTYDSYGQKLTTTDPRGNITTQTYDPQGHVTSVTDALGNTTTYTYDALGNRIREIDALGHTTTSTYDAEGNVMSTTNALGHSTTSMYDPNGNRLTETRTLTTPDGTVEVTTTSLYDPNNRLIEMIDPEGHSTTTEYDAAGQHIATIDKRGFRTEYVYDPAGRLTRLRYPDGTETSSTYDAVGNVLTSTDGAGRITSYTYDALGRKVKTTFPDGSFTQTWYDPVGRVQKVADAFGHETTYAYDPACQCPTGRQKTETDALGNTTSSAYDENGNLTTITDVNGHSTTVEYDGNNRKIRTVLADGSFTTIEYDALGHKIAETDQAGTTTSFTYDALGRLVAVTDALNQVTRYAYDEAGNQISQTDANDQTTRFVYDTMGRRITRILPLGMEETTVYDASGNVIAKTDFNGDTISFAYDENDRVIAKTFPDGTSEQYTYTPAGQIASVEDIRGTTSYVYDTMDRLLTQTNSDGTVLSYTYDLNGNRTSVTTPSGTTTSTYDALNRLETVTDPDGGVTSYTYDAVGNRTRVSSPNLTRTEYQYDTLNRLIVLEHNTAIGTPIGSFQYTLNPDGSRAQVIEQNGRTVRYTYDDVKRLVEERITEPSGEERVIQYSYDAVGNRLTKDDNGEVTTYTYDENNRLLTENASSYTYDNNGNTLSQENPQETMTYSYDFRNRLVRADIDRSGDMSVAEYLYDHDGIRVGKTINGIEKIDYLVDKNRAYAQVLEERDGAGSLLVSYIYGDDLISQNRAGTQRYYQYDGLGSTRALTDASGNTTDTYTYEAYGTLLASQGATENAYLFTGEQYDPNTGFYYLRARYLNLTAGRFVTMDTFEGAKCTPLSLHKYLYAHGNPVNAIDPSGNLTLKETLIAGGIIVTVAGIAVESFMYSPLYPYGSGQCGPDVTARLDRTLQEIRNTYDGWKDY